MSNWNSLHWISAISKDQYYLHTFSKVFWPMSWCRSRWPRAQAIRHQLAAKTPHWVCQRAWAKVIELQTATAPTRRVSSETDEGGRVDTSRRLNFLSSSYTDSLGYEGTWFLSRVIDLVIRLGYICSHAWIMTSSWLTYDQCRKCYTSSTTGAASCAWRNLSV